MASRDELEGLNDAELDLIIQGMWAWEQEFRTSFGDWSDFERLMERLIGIEKRRAKRLSQSSEASQSREET